MDKSKIENTTLEFKNYVNGFNDRHKKKLCKTIIAMANSQGGEIFVNKDDNGNIVDKVDKKVINFICEKANIETFISNENYSANVNFYININEFSIVIEKSEIDIFQEKDNKIYLYRREGSMISTAGNDFIKIKRSHYIKLSNVKFNDSWFFSNKRTKEKIIVFKSGDLVHSKEQNKKDDGIEYELKTKEISPIYSGQSIINAFEKIFDGKDQNFIKEFDKKNKYFFKQADEKWSPSWNEFKNKIEFIDFENRWFPVWKELLQKRKCYENLVDIRPILPFEFENVLKYKGYLGDIKHKNIPQLKQKFIKKIRDEIDDTWAIVSGIWHNFGKRTTNYDIVKHRGGYLLTNQSKLIEEWLIIDLYKLEYIINNYQRKKHFKYQNYIKDEYKKNKEFILKKMKKITILNIFLKKFYQNNWKYIIRNKNIKKLFM